MYNFNRKNDINNMLNHNIINKYNKLINFNSQQIKNGTFGSVKNFNKFVVKSFKNTDDYFHEKEIFTTKLPQYGGCLFKENNKLLYEYNGSKIIINPLYENDNMIITDKTIIKNIIKLSSKQIDKIIISEQETYIITENNLKIGFYIKKKDIFNIYIDSFKIMRLLYFDDNNKSLYYENLGEDLTKSFENRYPPYEQRIFMAIDLIRQVKELINLSIYHNDIKNDNIVLKSLNMNYYINLVDYGISVTINDLLNFEYLTSSNCFSPEYYIINILLNNKKPNITNIIDDLNNIFPDIYKKYENNKNLNVREMKELLDKSLHWIIGGIIINILSWKDVQYPIWDKHYYQPKNNIDYNNYSSQTIALSYTKEILCELFKNNFLYDDSFYLSDDYSNIIIDSINKFSNYDSIKNIIDDRFKDELIDFILIVYNLFEFLPGKKISLSDMYEKLKDYPGYQKYLATKPSFL
jgi:hypothetical protein